MNKQKRIMVVLLAVVLLGGSVLAAQQSQGEKWLGTLDVKVATLRLQLNLEPAEDGTYSGAMVSLDQNGIVVPMDTVVRNDDQLEFEIKKLGIRFKGQMNDDQSLATGTFTQGADFEMEFKRVERIPTEKHTSSWRGILKAAGQEFDFQFRVFEDEEGNHRVKLDSFSEGLLSLPCRMTMDGNEVQLFVPTAMARFEGTISDDQQTVEGKWIQRGGEYPLTLKNVPLEETRVPKLNRPQTPQPPFDYDLSEFSVTASEINDQYDKDVVLAGTLTSPRGAGPFPTVILISGSGPQDRDETIFDHKPFLVLADHLTKNGFAVVRYDERGVGESKGNFATATSADLAEDVEALFGWARQQPKIDGTKIVLAGHSEGGLVAPMIASRRPEVAGVIMLAGPGVPGEQIILNQTRKIAAAAGMPENILKMQDNMLRKLMVQLKSPEGLTDDFAGELDQEFDDVSDPLKKTLGLENLGIQTIARMKSPWMKYFVIYDPESSLKATRCPILSVIGEKDLQVDPELNLPAIEAAVKAGGNQDFTQKELPGLNHLFQNSKTGSPAEYMRIEQTLDPSLLETVTQWLQERYQ